jgi:hypothetical protein
VLIEVYGLRLQVEVVGGDDYPVVAINTGNGWLAENGRPRLQVRLNGRVIHQLLDETDPRWQPVRPWQPMELAPKDGTYIMVRFPAGAGRSYEAICKWQGPEAGDPADWPQGWRHGMMVNADATEWMPIPA